MDCIHPGFGFLICSLWSGKDSDEVMFTGAEMKMNHMASSERAAGREKCSVGPITGLLPGCSSGEEA